jgi:diguanylate cyclase (GGDEF)-like protein
VPDVDEKTGSNSQTRALEFRESAVLRARTRTPVLVVVQGPRIGRRYLLDERRVILGRSPGRADLVLEDPSVSGKHAALQIDPDAGRYGIIDLASRNGTFLNGRRVESGALRDGDKIFVGETVLKFTFHDSIEEDFHSRLEQLIHVDSLTGLRVRRWFDAEFPKEFRRARVAGRPFCVLMMDMDGLKEVNDRHGHQMGSYCISEAGKIIKRRVEPNGFGARFGGDEFVAFLRNCEIDQATEVAELIRRDVETFDFRKDGVTVAPTLSIGVAELSREIGSAEQLMRLADDALYRAKKAGRNAVSR